LSEQTLRSMRRDILEMRSAGALAYVRAEVDSVEEALTGLPDWRPARALLAEARWVRDRISSLSEAWGSKLLVAIVGPSGAGKSTLLNALAGAELSPVGLTRPTTRKVVLYVEHRVDAEPVLARLGAEHVEVCLASRSQALRNLILADTPDTNTMAENRALLSRLLEGADLILTVFPAHNPRLLDNIRFLAPHVRDLPADSVIPVLNKVDRVPPESMKETLADLHRMLEEEWRLSSARIYAISARSSAPGGDYIPDEEPLQDLNEFDVLRAMIFATLDHAQQVVDRRLSHAEHLVGLLKEDAERALSEQQSARRAADARLEEIEEGTRHVLEEAVAERAKGQSLELHVAVYASLAQRWWGPIGWLVGVWALVLRAIAFVGRTGHARSSISQGPSGGSESRPPRLTEDDVLGLIRSIEHRYAEAWPPVADLLVKAGFESRVRDALEDDGALDNLATEVRRQAAGAYDGRLSVLARRLSAWPVQALLNAPIMGIVVWIAVETFRAFFGRDYLPLEYFRHAGIVVLVVWLVSFVLLQVIVSLCLRGPFRRGVARALAATLATMPRHSLREQIARLEALQQLLADSRPPDAGVAGWSSSRS